MRVPHIGAGSHHVKPRRPQQPYPLPSHHRTGRVNVRKEKNKIHRSPILSAPSTTSASSSVASRPIHIRIIASHRILSSPVARPWEPGDQAPSLCGGARHPPPPPAQPIPCILRWATGAGNAGPSSTWHRQDSSDSARAKHGFRANPQRLAAPRRRYPLLLLCRALFGVMFIVSLSPK